MPVQSLKKIPVSSSDGYLDQIRVVWFSMAVLGKVGSPWYVKQYEEIWYKWPLGALIAQACHASCAALHTVFRDDIDTQEYLGDIDRMHKVANALQFTWLNW
jgi:hypothetical protein